MTRKSNASGTHRIAPNDDELPPALDLTPKVRTSPRGSRAKLRNWVLIGSVVLVLGFVLFKALSSASVYFYNVDEAIEQKAELADRTFRMQGVVVSEPSTDATGVLSFEVSFNDVNAEIRHIGEEPTDLFELGMPVVVEGRWNGRVFESTQILIKHSETYVAENEGDSSRPGVGENGVLP